MGEDDHFDGKPLYESIVLKAREQGLAGATVLRGPMGFGHSSLVHTAKILRLSQDLPVVVDIVDSKEKITAFLPLLDGMVKGGLVTLEARRRGTCSSVQTSSFRTGGRSLVLRETDEGVEAVHIFAARPGLELHAPLRAEGAQSNLLRRDPDRFVDRRSGASGR
jgi:uncharacterized protein